MHCKGKRPGRAVCGILFISYTLFMLYLLLIRGRGGIPADPAVWRKNQLNLIPFHTVREYLADLGNTADPAKVRAAFINLGGNILLFIPFGFLIPCLFRRFRSLSGVLILMALAVTAVETLQLLTCRGSCDIDDLFLNLTGTAGGYLLFLLPVLKNRGWPF